METKILPQFGKTTIGADYDDIPNEIQGSRFLCLEDGYAISLTAALANFQVGDRVKAAIYRASDLSFLATTEEVVGEQPLGWVTFNIIGQPQVKAGEEYILVCWSNADVNFYRDGAPELIGIIASVAYGDWPTSLTGISGPMTKEYSIYCTYTTTPPPPPPLTHVLTIVASTGGTTNPAPSTYSVNEGDPVSVTAVANSGYAFNHWELDDLNVGTANPYILIMDMDHSLLAVFTQLPPPTTHLLTVDSTPIQGVPFTIERV